MPVCKVCQDEVDAVVAVKVDGKVVRMCEECRDREREKREIAEAGQEVVRNMMEYKERW
jgi:ribosome-binding protein aMBF1 (putative translation factor)